MARIRSKEVYEAEQLLEEVLSWTDDEVEQLPKFYREKAKQYRELAESSE